MQGGAALYLHEEAQRQLCVVGREYTDRFVHKPEHFFGFDLLRLVLLLLARVHAMSQLQ
jgi:hypothetical protein